MERAGIPRWVGLVLVLAHGLVLGWALHYRAWDFPDTGRYQQAAANLEQHAELYARAWPAAGPRGQAVQEFTIRPPGYPAGLAVLGGAGGSPWLVLLVQNGLSLLVLGTVLRWWSRRTRPRTRHWLGALALVMTFPAQLIYTNAVMSEAFLQATLLGLAAAAVAFANTGRGRYWAGGALAVTLGLLLKPVAALLAVGLAGLGLGLAWQRQQWRLGAIGALPLLVVLGYMQWNQQRTGYFHFSSITEINLLHYNAAGVVRATAGPAAEDAWVASVLQAAGEQPDFASRQRLVSQRAEQVIRTHPWAYARQHALGMGAFLLDPGRFDISQFLGLGPRAGQGLLAQVRDGGAWPAVRALPPGLLLALAVVLAGNVLRLLLAARGFRRLGRGGRGGQAARWVAAGLLLYLAALTGPIGAARFLMPAWPLLLGLALMGLRGPAASATAKPQEAAASA